MKPILITIFMIVCLMAPCFAEKTVTLNDLHQPYLIAVDNDQLYITEKTSVHIYSLNDFKLKKTFGKSGEGPQEFRQMVLRLYSLNDSLFINSSGKISWFKKDGTFIKEARLPDPRLRFRPFGKQFLVNGMTFENGFLMFTVSIYDGAMAKVKEIHRQKRAVQAGGKGTRIFTHPLTNTVWDGKIFIASSLDFHINVMDATGKKLYAITHDLNRIPISEKDKKDVLKFLNNDKSTKPFIEMIKPITFPDKYPAIRKFYVADDKVYALTYRFAKEPGKTDCLIFNVSGKFLKQTTVKHYRMDNPVDDYPSYVRNGKLYWITENENTEEWELQICDLK